MGSSTLEGTHAQWACMLQEYNFVIVHRPGPLNANADALSRMPLPSTQDTTGVGWAMMYRCQVLFCGATPTTAPSIYMSWSQSQHMCLACMFLLSSTPCCSQLQWLAWPRLGALGTSLG